MFIVIEFIQRSCNTRRFRTASTDYTNQTRGDALVDEASAPHAHAHEKRNPNNMAPPFHDVVVALLAAGDDDAEALADAVARAEAAGLDGVPGEDRQKLRGVRAAAGGGGFGGGGVGGGVILCGASHPLSLSLTSLHLLLSQHLFRLIVLKAARTRLRKAREAAAAREAASAASAERSPFAKDSYDVADFGRLSGLYESLKWRMIQKPGGASVRPGMTRER